MPSSDRHSITLLHLSDLHFGAHDQDKINAVYDVVKRNDIDFACITGDIVDSPWWRSYFQRAAEFINNLKPLCNHNIFTIPGNHDALARSMSLKKYRRYMGRSENYCKHLLIRGLDICIFGIDTTSFSILHANNSGSFDQAAQDLLRKHIREMKRTLGEDAFRRAVKIFLVHHHPMPTGSAHLEGMLYFKNSGQFLKMAGTEDIDLILHGHQHDPHYYRLDYNVGVDTESIVVLSAGTACKMIEEKTPLGERAQFYIVRVHPDKNMEIDSFNYYSIGKKFENSRHIETRPKHKHKVGRRKDGVKYRMLRNGDMEVTEWREVSAVKGEVIDSWPIAMGVDEKGRECAGLNELNLQVFLGKEEISKEKIEIIEDGSREKRLRLALNDPISLEPVEIKWTYIWPGGFEELLADGRGAGTFLIVERTASLYVEFEAEAHDIKGFKVVYHDMGNVKYRYDREPRRRAFEIPEPLRTQIVQFDVIV